MRILTAVLLLLAVPVIAAPNKPPPEPQDVNVVNTTPILVAEKRNIPFNALASCVIPNSGTNCSQLKFASSGDYPTNTTLIIKQITVRMSSSTEGQRFSYFFRAHDKDNNTYEYHSGRKTGTLTTDGLQSVFIDNASVEINQDPLGDPLEIWFLFDSNDENNRQVHMFISGYFAPTD